MDNPLVSILRVMMDGCPRIKPVTQAIEVPFSKSRETLKKSALVIFEQTVLQQLQQVKLLAKRRVTVLIWTPYGVFFRYIKYPRKGNVVGC